jgi:cobalt-zinc-cadmium efflux system protein
MAHDDHDHGFEQEGTSGARAFAVGVALNSAIVAMQVVFGLLAHSMALVADAGHNLGDVLALALGWAAASAATRAPTRTHTYGFRRATILAALANSILLLAATGAVGWESLRRLGNAGEVHAETVVVVAGIGIVVNGLAALLFMRRRREDLNVRSAFLHLASDAAVSLGVVATGLIQMKTGWRWLDPLAGLAISFLILIGTWSLFRQSFRLAMDAVPEAIDLDKVRAYLAEIGAVHDLHVWSISTTETALTGHIVLPDDARDTAELLDSMARELKERFGIGHATLQLERIRCEAPCRVDHAE